MLPLAIGAVIALRQQIKIASGFEKKVCVVGFWLALSLIVIRDINMSYRICEVVDGISGLQNAFKELDR
jgi:hypothetical protein